MSPSRYVVLGFRNPDGGLGFCCTTSPLTYLARLKAGEYRSRLLDSALKLAWAIPCSGHAKGIELRDALNERTHAVATILASLERVSSDTATTLERLADEHCGEVLNERVENDANETAWLVIDRGVNGSSPPPDSDSYERDLDDPFVALPEPGDWRARSDTEWVGVAELPAALFIFDLDGTLVDSSALTEARDGRGWGEVRRRLHEVVAFPTWGSVAPHELPALLMEHDYRVAVVSRAPP